MLFKTATSFLAVAAAAAAAVVAENSDEGWEMRYTATDVADVASAASKAKTSTPMSHVAGKAFNRFVIIYFENQNYDKAYGDG